MAATAVDEEAPEVMQAVSMVCRNEELAAAMVVEAHMCQLSGILHRTSSLSKLEVKSAPRAMKQGLLHLNNS